MAAKESTRTNGVEVVGIMTPSGDHYKIAKPFIENKVHIICDKPLTATLGEAIKLALSEKIQVLLAGMQIPQNYGTEYTESFRNAFYELAEQYHLKMIPFLLKGVGGIPSLNQADGIHPNPEGHQIIVRTVVEYLEPLLPIRQ